MTDKQLEELFRKWKEDPDALDEFEKAALEGYQLLGDESAAKSLLSEAAERFTEQLPAGRRRSYLPLAASIALLLLAALLLLLLGREPERDVAQANVPEVPAHVLRKAPESEPLPEPAASGEAEFRVSGNGAGPAKKGGAGQAAQEGPAALSIPSGRTDAVKDMEGSVPAEEAEPPVQEPVSALSEQKPQPEEVSKAKTTSRNHESSKMRASAPQAAPTNAPPSPAAAPTVTFPGGDAALREAFLRKLDGRAPAKKFVATIVFDASGKHEKVEIDSDRLSPEDVKKVEAALRAVEGFSFSLTPPGSSLSYRFDYRP